MKIIKIINMNLEINNIHFSYGAETLLKNINLSVNKGKIYGISGLNGSGKTTLLKVIKGEVLPQQGSVKSSGYVIGYVPQDNGLWDTFYVREVLTIFQKIPDEETFNSFLYDSLNVDELKNRKISELSHGQLKRVQIYVGSLNRPDYILLDEPFSGLDYGQKERLKNFLISIKSDIGIFLTSHDLNIIKNTCDESYIIQNQRLVSLFDIEAGDFRKFIQES